MKSVVSQFVPFSLVALCLLAATPVFSADATTAKAPLVSDNFDDLVPGSTPKNWSVLWGKQGEDQLSVSNVQSVSKGNSLLIDRVLSDEKSHYGIGTRFPNVKTGWAVTSFDIRTDGLPSSIRLGIEIRGYNNHPDSIVTSLGLFGNRIELHSSDRKTRVASPATVAGKWYRVALWLPTKGGEQTTGYAIIKERTDAGEWKALGTKLSVPVTQPVQDYGHILFNVHPDQRDFRTFIDNFTVEQSDKSLAD